MSTSGTPITRARLALRAVYKFQQGGRRRAVLDLDEISEAEARNAGDAPERQDSAAVGSEVMIPLLRKPKTRRTSSGGPDVEAPSQDDETVASRILACELPHLSSALSGQMSEDFRRLGSGSGVQTLPDNQGAAAGDNSAPGIVSLTGDTKAVWGLLTSSWLNLLLLSVPLGYAAHVLNWSPIARFSLNFMSLVPLALLLGEVTEDLALRFGDTIGGLLNATFGNVVELILSIAALRAGLYDVVATSLVGSVLSNLLLVLGCCFLVGGTQYHNQNFNAQTNKAMCSLLMLAAIALAMPTAAHHLTTKDAISQDALLKISHATSILLVIMYCFYLYFQLKTHPDMDPQTGEPSSLVDDDSEEQESAEGPALSFMGAMTVLTCITVLVAAASEFLTGSIEEVSAGTGIKRAFLGLIVLPIAGNACEHITAVFVAAKNKMDLAIGVALGSSIQIAIFVVPVVCLAGWAMGRPFTLDLEPLSVIILTLSVIHAYFVSNDGQSNWLMGVQLITTYLLIAIVYFYR